MDDSIKTRRDDPMGHEEELIALRKEWRDGIQHQLSDIKANQVKMFETLDKIRENYAKGKTLDEMQAVFDAKISSLQEKYDTLIAAKNKVIGIIIGIQVVAIFVVWMIEQHFVSIGNMAVK